MQDMVIDWYESMIGNAYTKTPVSVLDGRCTKTESEKLTSSLPVTTTNVSLEWEREREYGNCLKWEENPAEHAYGN